MNFANITPILADTMTLAEKSISSAKVILTGFVVVFVVLFLLIFIINIYGAIIQKATQGGKKKKEKISEPEKNSATPSVVSRNTASASASAPNVQNGISEEVVAVITAAVAASSDSSSRTRIKSIKKSDGSRSAWANAGILDNTRPF